MQHCSESIALGYSRQEKSFDSHDIFTCHINLRI